MSTKPSTAANANGQMEAEIKAFPAPEPTSEADTEIKLEAPVPVEKPAEAPAPLAAAAPKRSRWRRNLTMLIVPLALAGGGTYVWITGGRYEETDNANLRQARVSMVSEASGRLAQVNVRENQPVKKGDLLFEIETEPYSIALAQADAAIAQARLSVEQLRAGYSQAVRAKKVAADQVSFLQAELDRQNTLTKRGIGTAAALDSAGADLKKAQGQLASADEAVTGAIAALGGDPKIETDKHPAVQAALSARDKAAYALSQTQVRAPDDGVVYQAASVKPGQFVAVGTPLFALVETGDAWVDANFKETQLTHMKVGQAAEIRLDAFPDSPLHAVIDSIGAGTGAEFSVLPAQNATGNWVKVTQRIPVRLKVESPDAGLLLRTGMSATVEVDTGKARGWTSLTKYVPGWAKAYL